MAQAAKERPHRVQAMVGIATWADVQGAVNRWAKPKEVMNFLFCLDQLQNCGHFLKIIKLL